MNGKDEPMLAHHDTYIMIPFASWLERLLIKRVCFNYHTPNAGRKEKSWCTARTVLKYSVVNNLVVQCARVRNRA